MTFPREAIMERLVEVVRTAAVPLGVKNVHRNFARGPADQAPFIVVLEGDEHPRESEKEIDESRPPQSPRVVEMFPHVVIAFGTADAQLSGGANALYAVIIKAVLTDTALAGLTKDSRGVRFMGMESDLAIMRPQLGNMAVKFRFVYRLAPSEL